MGKRARHTSIYPPKKQNLHNKSDWSMEDRISQLPNEIIVSILSRLTISEAARTSALSRRWKDLWTFSTGSMNFDGSNKKREVWDDPNPKLFFKTVRSKYINCVNKVCKSHEGPTIDEFRVRFMLGKRNRHHLDKWIKFAIAKKVKRLEVDLSPFHWGLRSPSEPYTFSHESCVHIRSPIGLSCIKSLKSLSLNYVNVTGELAEYILSSCPLLERLCLQGSEHLVDLKVAGSSLMLKHLEIIQCLCLNYVEIYAPNLVSFKYLRQKIRLNIKYAPQLVDVSIGGRFNVSVSDAVSILSNYLLQLKALTLGINRLTGRLVYPRFPVLYNLKQLTWIVHSNDWKSLIDLTSLIEACPFLQRFTLQLLFCGHSRREIKKAARHPHQCLRVVEFNGFVGSKIDVELAMYFLENAVKLEKFIVSPHYQCSGSPKETDEESKEEAAGRKRALKLRKKVPPGVELIVL